VAPPIRGPRRASRNWRCGAALGLGPKGIRVNVLHPDAVLDTAIWTP